MSNRSYLNKRDDLDAGAIGKSDAPRNKAKPKDGLDRSTVLQAIAADHVKLGRTFEEYDAAWRENDDAAAHIHKHATKALQRRAVKRQWEWACDNVKPAFNKYDDEDDDSNSAFFSILNWDEAVKVSHRQFLYGVAYTRGFVSATVAPGGMGKTSLLVSEAMAMTSGQNLLGDNVTKPLRVCMWNLEDDMEEMHRRFAAARLQFAEEIEGTGYERRLILKAVESPLSIARLERGVVVFNEKLIKRIIAWIKKLKIDVLVIDPFIASHGVAGNDNDAIGKVARLGWGRIAKDAKCAVMLAHHTRKGAPGQMAFNIDDTLGAGALINAVRYGRVLNRMDPEAEAPKLGVAPDCAWAFVRVDHGKGNHAPPQSATWRHLKSVELPNRSSFAADDADRIGVAVDWTPPDISTTTSDERGQIVEAMGDEPWRASPQAKGWVGEAVAKALGIDLDTATGKAAVAAKVKAMIRSGWLIEEEGLDQNRQKRPMVRVAPPTKMRVRRSRADLLG